MSIENRTSFYPGREVDPSKKGAPNLRVVHKSQEQVAENLQATPYAPSPDGVSFSQEKPGENIPTLSLQELLHLQAEKTPNTLRVIDENLTMISDELPTGTEVPAGFGFINGQRFQVQLLKLQLEIYNTTVQKAKEEYQNRVQQLLPDSENLENEKLKIAVSVANGLIAEDLGATQDNEAYKQVVGEAKVVSMEKTKGVEVCLQKSLLAHHIVRKLGHQGKSKVCLESNNDPSKEGHAYCLIHRDGERKKRHPNMPIVTNEGFAPRIEDIHPKETAKMEYKTAA